MTQTELSEMIAAGVAARDGGFNAAVADLEGLKPPDGLQAIGYWDAIETLAAKYRYEAVDNVRNKGTSWDQVGAVLGINGANARQRWMRSRSKD